MSPPRRLWIQASAHAAFRVGGWAYVLSDGGALTGFAGGERNVTPGRIVATALLTALTETSKAGQPLTVHSASPAVLAFGRAVASGASLHDKAAPGEDLDVWNKIAAVLAGEPIDFQPMELRAGSPGGFVAAWAELARDKAKAAGPFRAAIPKTNLVKISGAAGG